MKKLNNKGITTIEVLICFVLVVIITVSMFATVSSYNNKRNEERNKEEINVYKETITKEIQDDFIKIGLINADYNKETSDDKTTTYSIDCTLKDGTQRRLEIIQRFTKSTYHPGGTEEADDYYMIKYGTPDDMIEYPIPDLGSFKNKETNKTVKDLSINNVLIKITDDSILSIYIGFYHPELTTKFAISIISPINYVFSPSGQEIDTSMRCPTIIVKDGDTVLGSNVTTTAEKLDIDFDFDSSIKEWDFLTDDDGNEPGATYVESGGIRYRLWNHYDTETTTTENLTTEGNRRILLYIYNQMGDVKECSYGPYNIDRSPPACPTISSVTSDNNTYTPNTWTNKNITLNYSFDPETVSWDYQTGLMNQTTLSDVVNNSPSVTSTSFTTDGAHRVVATVRDEIGNSQVCEYSGYLIDKTAPECPTTTASISTGAYTTNTYTNQNINLTFNFPGDVANWDWATSLNNGSWTTQATNIPSANNTKVFSVEGNNSGKIIVRDEVGNEKECVVSGYLIDKTAPKITSIKYKYRSSIFGTDGKCQLTPGGTECENNIITDSSYGGNNRIEIKSEKSASCLAYVKKGYTNSSNCTPKWTDPTTITKNGNTSKIGTIYSITGGGAFVILDPSSLQFTEANLDKVSIMIYYYDGISESFATSNSNIYYKKNASYPSGNPTSVPAKAVAASNTGETFKIVVTDAAGNSNSWIIQFYFTGQGMFKDPTSGKFFWKYIQYGGTTFKTGWAKHYYLRPSASPKEYRNQWAYYSDAGHVLPSLLGSCPNHGCLYQGWLKDGSNYFYLNYNAVSTEDLPAGYMASNRSITACTNNDWNTSNCTKTTRWCNASGYCTTP